MFFSLLLPILYIQCIIPPANNEKQQKVELHDVPITVDFDILDLHTSSPVEASMSRNSSTNVRTSLAAFALLTDVRNGLVNFINPASSTSQM